MAGTQLKAAEAAAVVNELLDACDGISRTISNVQSTFDAARAGWQGEAAVAGQKASEDWQSEVKRINDRLDEIKETVSEGNKTLTNVDAENVDALTNLI
ncbi:WXG100 family type VII secretion target [Nocardia transvalensis]|uniref:WXG100 family type VII secretion target n=1 Tax=Nocardia transvalensis TaxID=37333 RepID=UPI0018933C4C|nr:WXG100 family type VII secretion target [Nocardia transvalensis]MBF6327520.1 WXG100 family type VII secretion target [Nocardia transvalensis]